MWVDLSGDLVKILRPAVSQHSLDLMGEGELLRISDSSAREMSRVLGILFFRSSGGRSNPCFLNASVNSMRFYEVEKQIVNVSAPAHGIHPPEKLLFFTPELFRRILKISQRGLCWLRGKQESQEPGSGRTSEKLKVARSEKEVWSCYEPTNAHRLRECGKDWNRWQRVREYYREIEKD